MEAVTDIDLACYHQYGVRVNDKPHVIAYALSYDWSIAINQ